jgi:hypothetical protein
MKKEPSSLAITLRRRGILEPTALLCSWIERGHSLKWCCLAPPQKEKAVWWLSMTADSFLDFGISGALGLGVWDPGAVSRGRRLM